jgi:hypothetical protein
MSGLSPRRHMPRPAPPLTRRDRRSGSGVSAGLASGLPRFAPRLRRSERSPGCDLHAVRRRRRRCRLRASMRSSPPSRSSLLRWTINESELERRDDMLASRSEEQRDPRTVLARLQLTPTAELGATGVRSPMPRHTRSSSFRSLALDDANVRDHGESGSRLLVAPARRVKG